MFVRHGDVSGQIPARPKAKTSTCISHQAAPHRGGETHTTCAVPELMLKAPCCLCLFVADMLYDGSNLASAALLVDALLVCSLHPVLLGALLTR